MSGRFAAFVAIDWSGAKGRRHKGIAIAEARGNDAPRLVRPGHVWSREDVLDWLLEQAAKEPTLFGFDFSFAPPFVERLADDVRIRAGWAGSDDKRVGEFQAVDGRGEIGHNVTQI